MLDGCSARWTQNRRCYVCIIDFANEMRQVSYVTVVDVMEYNLDEEQMRS